MITTISVAVIIALTVVYVLPKCVHIDITVKPTEQVAVPQAAPIEKYPDDMPSPDDLIKAINETFMEVDISER